MVLTLRRFVVSGVVTLVALLAWGEIGADRALAQGVPDISVIKGGDDAALLGGVSAVTLRAQNPTGEVTGYNLTFRDVLPVGVDYVPGSTSPGTVGEPEVIVGQPSAGQTTLIWSNVSDLTPNSSFDFTYEVMNSDTRYAIGDTFTNNASAYINCSPLYIPKFDDRGLPQQTGGSPDCSGEPPEKSYTGWSSASHTTTVVPIQLTKSHSGDPAKLLRGLHKNQIAYTLNLSNNHANDINAIQLEDYLPAGLEYLGCGTADNTTDSPSNPGSTEEYPGSGPINPGNAPAVPNCVDPDLVETVLNPPGQPAGVYTHLVWSLGSLPSGDSVSIQYVAAVPLRANTMDWPGGEPPTTGEQGSNLDNNSGPETSHEQSMTNYARVDGDYDDPSGAIPVFDSKSDTVIALDGKVLKDVNTSSLGSGEISQWTLTVQTGEYRFLENVILKDTLGNGYCPLGASNFEHTPPPPSTECEPIGVDPSMPYTSVEERANGTWDIVWDSTTMPALGSIDPDSEVSVTFPSRTRTHYQEDFEDAGPVVARDSLTNEVDLEAEAWIICAPGAPTPCPPGDPRKIDGGDDGVLIEDDSAAGQQGGSPTVEKQISPTLNGDCPNLTDYTRGVVPLAAPGDSVCWRLIVDFPDSLVSADVKINDFVPESMVYVPGSSFALPGNTVAIDSPSPPEPIVTNGFGLSWPVGSTDAEVPPGQRFDLVMKTRVERNTLSEDGKVGGNLLKGVFANSATTTFPLRDSQAYELTQPEISLVKGVMQVEGQPVAGNPPGFDNAIVRGGDVVTYRVDMTNDGSLEATSTEVWDVLPTETTCADLRPGSISHGGVCNPSENRIEWLNGPAVPADSSVTLTYDLIIPDELPGGDALTNQAGVREYQSASGSGPYTHIPGENIDPTQDSRANAPSAKDQSRVTIEQSIVIKTRSTQIDQPGNDPASQATIGEVIDYTVRVTIPDGTSLHGDDASFVDDVSSRMQLISGSAEATLDDGTGGGPVPLPAGGMALSEVGNQVRIDFPDPYLNPDESGDDVVVVTFRAVVRDLYPENYAQGSAGQYTMPNTATVHWRNAAGVARSASDTINTTLVEPRISLNKTADTAGPVSPGDVVNYTLTLANSSAARVSTANETTLVDTVPEGLIPANGGTPVADGDTLDPDGGVWNASDRTITWPMVETLAPGASRIYRFEAIIDDPAVGSQILINRAQARTTSMPGQAPSERDSLSTAPGYLANAQLPLQVISPGIEKTGTPERATIGQRVTQTIYASIGGLLTDYDGAVIDDLPDGLIFDEYISVSCVTGCVVDPPDIQPLGVVPNGNGQRIGWWIGDVPAIGESRMVALTYSAYIADEYQGGGKVLGGTDLENTASLLYNLSSKVTEPPTSPPDPGDFDEVLESAHSTTVIEPNLVIDKVVSEDPDEDDERTTRPGDSYTYSINVTNTGDFPAREVQVTDQLDPALVNVVVQTNPAAQLVKQWSPADRQFEWFIPGQIDPGQTVTLTYTADLDASSSLSAGQQVVNTATAPSYWAIPESEREDPVNDGITFREYEADPDTVTLTVALPDLAVDKTTGLPGYPESGTARTEDPFPWRVVVNNSDQGSLARDVDLTDTLPPNWTYVPGSAQISGTGSLTPGGQVEPVITSSPSGDVLRWGSVADLPNDSNAIVEFEATPSPAAAITPGLPPNHVNQAVATGTDASDATESADGPYRAEDDAFANLAAVETDLAIQKDPATTTPVAGTNLTWTLSVRNNGPKVAPSVEVSDVLLAGLTLVSAVTEQGTCAESPAGTVTCSLGQINADDSVEITLITAVDPDTAGQSLINRTIVTDPTVDDTDPSNDESEATVLPTGRADLSVTKGIQAPLYVQQVATYEMVVANAGPSVSRDVTLTDTLPPGLSFESAQTPVGSCINIGQGVSCSLGDIDPADSVTIRISVAVGDGGRHENCVAVTATTTDPVQNNNRSCRTDQVVNADLAIDKSAPNNLAFGKNRNYTLRVGSVGDPPSTGTVTVTDSVPNVLEPRSAAGNGWECSIDGQLVTCTRADSIGPGQGFPPITITVRARKNLVFRAVDNTARVSLNGDPNPSNDVDTARVRRGAVCRDGSLTGRPTGVWVGEETRVAFTLRMNGGALAAGIPVTIEGNGKGGAGKRTVKRRTDRSGRAFLNVGARDRSARWVAKVSQCGLRAKVRAKRQASCSAIRVGPRSVPAGRTSALKVRLRSPSGAPLRGVRVRVTGHGIKNLSRTNRRGIAKIRVSPDRSGVISVTAPDAIRCNYRIGVLGPNDGSYLTG